MAFVPVNSVIEAKLVATIDGQECINTMYFGKNAGAVVAADLLTVATFLEAVVSAHLSIWGTNTAFTRIETRDLTSEFSFSSSDAFTPGVTGSDTNVKEPNNAAFCVKLATGLSGRSFRGRNYMFGLTLSFLATPNRVNATYINNVEAYYAGIMAAAAADGFTMVVVSRFSGGAPRITGVATDVINVTVTDDVLDSQRRRLPGRGR